MNGFDVLSFCVGTGIWATIWLAWWMFNRWFWRVKPSDGVANPQ